MHRSTAAALQWSQPGQVQRGQTFSNAPAKLSDLEKSGRVGRKWDTQSESDCIQMPLSPKYTKKTHYSMKCCESNQCLATWRWEEVNKVQAKRKIAPGSSTFKDLLKRTKTTNRCKQSSEPNSHSNSQAQGQEFVELCWLATQQVAEHLCLVTLTSLR